MSDCRFPWGRCASKGPCIGSVGAGPCTGEGVPRPRDHAETDRGGGAVTIHPTRERPVLLDVTVRDGGYVIDHRWTATEAAAVVRAVVASGVGLTEVGYLRSGAGDPLRPSATCPPDFLHLLAEQAGWSRLVVMVRPGEVEPDRVAQVAGRGVGLVRVLVPRGDVAAARPLMDAARSGGAPVSANLTRVSQADPDAVAGAVRDCVAAGADVVYLADSNGSLFPDGVRERVGVAVRAAGGTPVGFHPHDNLGLAFINTCAALDAGATLVDASLGGVGKGGGNLRLELIAAHWVLRGLADVRIDPLLQDRTTTAVQLRMLADTGATPLMAGLLDVDLDGLRAFQEDVSRRGVDAVLRSARRAAQPA